MGVPRMDSPMSSGKPLRRAAQGLERSQSEPRYRRLLLASTPKIYPKLENRPQERGLRYQTYLKMIIHEAPPDAEEKRKAS